jgi:hypothetical protein
MPLTLHTHLRPGVMIAWVITWNALLVGGLMLDQSAGRQHVWFTSAFTLAALGTATLCLSVILLPRMQALVFHKGVATASVQRELWILTAVTGVCGMIVPVAGMVAR